MAQDDDEGHRHIKYYVNAKHLFLPSVSRLYFPFNEMFILCLYVTYLLNNCSSETIVIQEVKGLYLIHVVISIGYIQIRNTILFFL